LYYDTGVYNKGSKSGALMDCDGCQGTVVKVSTKTWNWATIYTSFVGTGTKANDTRTSFIVTLMQDPRNLINCLSNLLLYTILN